MAAATTLITAGTVMARDGSHAPGWVRVEWTAGGAGAPGRIAALGGGVPEVPAGAEVIALPEATLMPGFIDLHAHGACGHDTMDATPEALGQMARFYARHGTTSFLAATVSESPERLRAALQAVEGLMGRPTGGAALLGAHLEGPYIDVQRRGAHSADQVRAAAASEYAPLLQGRAVRLLSLAPEVEGAEQLIRSAVALGVVVSAGHTRATYEQMRHAVGLGVRQVTHLFNTMEPLHHRNPGVVGAALSSDALACEVIADNIHVHPAILRLVVRAKGLERVLLVTDAMRGTGMPDGEYTLGGQRVTVHGGEARLADNPGALAGSTLTMERALANIMAAADLTLAQALPMATTNPARALGIEGCKGAIAVGMDGDMVALDANLRVRLTMVGGQVVYRADGVARGQGG